MDALSMDTICRLYEVGRQRLAEEEDEEEDQVCTTLILKQLSIIPLVSVAGQNYAVFIDHLIHYPLALTLNARSCCPAGSVGVNVDCGQI